MFLTGFPQAFAINPHETLELGDDAGHQFGAVAMDAYGDFYRWAKAGGSNISLGKLQLAPAPKANHHNVAWASGGALNTNKVTVTLGATAAVANEYRGGLLIVNDATGEGTSYRISSHPAADASATLELTIEGAFHTALVSGSEVTLVHNPFNGVVEGTTGTRDVAGIPQRSVTAAYFFWAKVKGLSPALADETITLGAGVTIGTSTAGAVEEVDQPGDTTVLVDRQIGWATVAGVDTEYRPIMLELL